MEEPISSERKSTAFGVASVVFVGTGLEFLVDEAL